MKIDVYDFDGTIYDGDSSVDFFKFELKRNKSNIIIAFKVAIYYLLFFLKIASKEKVKEVFFSFLKKIPNIDSEIEDFWKQNKNKIKSFYIQKENHENDVIISASPEFLLKPIAEKYNVKLLIATNVNKHDGTIKENNCKGKEKVNLLYQKIKDAEIRVVYTDSMSDKPLIDEAESAYIVKKDKIAKIK